jgi:hypothetical protein
MPIDIGSALGSMATGGVVGLFGPIVTGGFGLLKGWVEHKQQVSLIKLTAEANTAQAASAIAVAREQGAAAAFTASIQSESASSGEHSWVKDFRGCTRPGLTWLSLIASIICGISGIENDLTLAINQHAGMMMSWWFGQRAIDKASISWGAGSIKGMVAGNSQQKP